MFTQLNIEPAGIQRTQTLRFCALCVCVLVVSWLLVLPIQAHSQQPELNHELMDFLAGDPVVDHGSDDLLIQLPQGSEEQITSGADIYTRHCAACHGDQLQGQPDWSVPGANGLLPAPPHDASGHTWHHADDELFEIVKYGPAIAMGDAAYRSMMPAFERLLTDNEIISVLVFIRSTWPGKQRDWQKAANDARIGKSWWKPTTD